PRRPPFSLSRPPSRIFGSRSALDRRLATRQGRGSRPASRRPASVAPPRAAPRHLVPLSHDGRAMIFQKIGTAIQAFFNGIANMFIERDPVAVMQLEIDRAADRLTGAREGLEQYQGLVQGLTRQVAKNQADA